MFITFCECSKCGKKFSFNDPLTICPSCEGALLFRYDLNRISASFPRNKFEDKQDTFWKFLELLPIADQRSIVSLGEPYTPLLSAHKNWGNEFKNVSIKDDGRLPTGTFKARGMAVAVSSLKELNVQRIVIPSAGNAAAALTAYGGKAGLSISVFMPKDVPEVVLKECVLGGANVHLTPGSISDAARMVRKLKSREDWFDLSTNKQPYRFEGCKVMAFEIAEQFDWDVPDNIFFPTGGGEGVIGLWKGFNELKALRWIKQIPRLIAVQSSGCAPLVDAFNNNLDSVKEAWKEPKTIASGLQVPFPYASYLVLHALRDTSGYAMAVSDKEIFQSMKFLLRNGVYACPEAASTFVAYKNIIAEGTLDASERTLLYLTGNALKYIDLMEMNREKLLIDT